MIALRLFKFAEFFGEFNKCRVLIEMPLRWENSEKFFFWFSEFIGKKDARGSPKAQQFDWFHSYYENETGQCHPLSSFTFSSWAFSKLILECVIVDLTGVFMSRVDKLFSLLTLVDCFCIKFKLHIEKISRKPLQAIKKRYILRHLQTRQQKTHFISSNITSWSTDRRPLI